MFLEIELSNHHACNYRTKQAFALCFAIKKELPSQLVQY